MKSSLRPALCVLLGCVFLACSSDGSKGDAGSTGGTGGASAGTGGASAGAGGTSGGSGGATAGSGGRGGNGGRGGAGGTGGAAGGALAAGRILASDVRGLFRNRPASVAPGYTLRVAEREARAAAE